MSPALPTPTTQTVKVHHRPDLVRVVGSLTAAALVVQVGIDVGVDAWLETMLFAAGAPPTDTLAGVAGALAVEVGPVGSGSGGVVERLVSEARSIQVIATASVWMLAAGVAVLLLREARRPRVSGDGDRPGVVVPLKASAI